ncbi:magnesium/cobalt transporter CorA [Flavihumibacter solisilvae]|jgi:magnesium transporter|uniref:Magnesium transport protein CorA n=1 Tax=Flavihumibacter solisilvae TaxID=1349421 RepID=A0A0C1IGU2_9BACT|nr:magnesium/cobalt transporter CorA [Flavihumibacter solisilvae]KIC93410.1 magnesium transporter [Flavihumibacter solisilvae]
MKEVINCAAYSNGIRVPDFDINHLDDPIFETQFVWVGLHEPGEKTLELFQRHFDLHDLAVEDAHNAHQRPKIERYGETLFIVLRTAQVNQLQHKIDFGETHFFIGSHFLLTVRHGSSISYSDVRSRCESMPSQLRIGQGFALYAVMDAIVDQYFPVVEALEEELLSIEDKVFADKPSRETTHDIYVLKRQMLEVKRAVSPLVDICNRLMRYDNSFISADTQPYFRDIYDHALRINEMVDHARELLNTALEANFSLISISQNDISKKFAGWAAIIAVPTMVAGFYGMNFKFMPELTWQYGYPVVVTGTIVACLLIYLLFRRSGWL